MLTITLEQKSSAALNATHLCVIYTTYCYRLFLHIECFHLATQHSKLPDRNNFNILTCKSSHSFCCLLNTYLQPISSNLNLYVFEYPFPYIFYIHDRVYTFFPITDGEKNNRKNNDIYNGLRDVDRHRKRRTG